MSSRWVFYLLWIDRRRRAHAAANTLFNISMHSANGAAAGIFGQRADDLRNLWKIDASGLF
jgi:hypothetical protein